MKQWLRRHRRFFVWLGTLALACAVVAILLGCILVFPAILVDRDLENRKEPPSAELLSATNDVRTTLLQGLAGAFFLATAFFTWRQIRIAQAQVRLTEEEQLATRFARGSEQLSEAKVNARLGGIYSLERIAWDSERDHSPIVEILTSFIRARSTWKPKSGDRWKRVAADVQAALSVLGRRNPAHEKELRFRLDLTGLDLRGAQLDEADLHKALLNGSHLERAQLSSANLEDARLVAAHLEKAVLNKAQLRRARLVDAHLEGAVLIGAQLQGALLVGAYLNGARLMSANLAGTNLRGATLVDARLKNATWDSKTIWPNGFDPKTATAGT